MAPGHRLLDAGSGRGGTSIMANAAFGCRVDGVSISQTQVDFANAEAERHGVAARSGSTSRTCSTPVSRRARSRRSGTTSRRCTPSWTTSSRRTPGSSPAAAGTSPSPAATTTCTGCRPRRSPRSTPTTSATSIRAAPTSAAWPPTGSCPPPSST
ncbi:SAM-dependent methyltransferase [Actinomadura madurae]|uniref:SAM-dependent methyltransferase n=1 Tax=Actinomadura madurae TaxID=1993 RepID=UPI0027E2C2CA|nr:hypothetical protein [Actinomadura madurae]